MKKKALSTLLAAALAAALLAGCGTSAETREEAAEEASAEEEAAEEETAAAAGETEYPITITDSYGEIVTVESEPMRVISVAPNLTETMFRIDAGDKLVGRSEYCDYPDEALEIESVGSIYEPDIEAIVSLEPDLVIVSTHFDEENTVKLEELGISVVTLYEEDEMEGVYGMIETLGEIMNRQEAAAECVAEMQDIIAEVEETVAGQEHPTAYYVVGFGEYGEFTAGGDTFTGQMLTMAGADNIAQDVSGWSITTEEIIEADPDIILTADYMYDEFKTTSPYSELTAVQEDRVYVIDNDLLEHQGYRNAEGVRAIAEICYPELFD